MTRRRLLVAVAFLALAGALVAEDRVRVSGGFDAGRGHLIAIICGWLAAAAVLALALVRLRPRHGIVITLVITGALQLLALRAGPQLSDDLYRYTWDAKVAAAGIDPYVYPPVAPQLDTLHDPYLWPSAAECETSRAALPRGARAYPFAAQHQPGCTRINRPDVRTLYPPVAQLWFRIMRAVTPDSARELQVEAPAAASALALTALLALLLLRLGRPPAWALLYGAGPLAGLETTMDGHVDAIGAILVLGALLLLARHRPGVRVAAGIGILLAAATLVKLYPALVIVPLVPALAGWRAKAALATAGLAASALLYAPHIVATDGRVLGYLPGYLSENGYDSGSRYVLLAPLHLGDHTAVLLGVAVVAAAAVFALLPIAPGDTRATALTLARRATAFVGIVFLLSTPGDAWYTTLLVVLAAVAGRPEWLLVVVANYDSYADALFNWRGDGPTICYLGAAGLVAAATVVRRRRPPAATSPDRSPAAAQAAVA